MHELHESLCSLLLCVRVVRVVRGSRFSTGVPVGNSEAVGKERAT